MNNGIPMNQEMLDAYVAKTNAVIADYNSKLVMAEVQMEQLIKQNQQLAQKVQEQAKEIEALTKDEEDTAEENCTETKA